METPGLAGLGTMASKPFMQRPPNACSALSYKVGKGHDHGRSPDPVPTCQTDLGQACRKACRSADDMLMTCGRLPCPPPYLCSMTAWWGRRMWGKRAQVVR